MKEYDGLEIRVENNASDNEPAHFEGNFVLRDWKGSGNRRRIVSCRTLKADLMRQIGNQVDNLSVFELSVADFGKYYDLCEMDSPRFFLRGRQWESFIFYKISECCTSCS